MSDYGADKNPDLNIAQEVTQTEKLLPLKKSNVMQWTYADGSMVQKYAHRLSGTNVHIKFKPT